MPQKLSSREIRRRTKQIRHAIDGTRRRLINLKFIRTAQFPYRQPSVPKGVDPLPKQSKQAVHSKQLGNEELPL